MLKFLLILILLTYLVYRVGGFFFKLLFYGGQQGPSAHRASRTPPNSNVRVDYMPKEDRKDRKNFEGGQYVDFEEVK